jgi:beta-N-acetylhexosaminidase
MVGFSGPSADSGLLARVRAGLVGSVILFGENIVSSSQLRSLTGTLQRAARQGGNPPLLISTDQEGGQVKRLPNGPPFLAPPDMVHTGNPAVAGGEGRAAGQYLKSRGINWDLAPVVDVPTFGGAFIWRQGRAFSFNSKTVARYATPFALGLQASGVAAAAKHFPGVGSAGVDTDNQRDILKPSAAQRSAALDPYRALIARGVDTIMLSTAGFPAYDPTGTPTALSRPIVQGLLRGQLRFSGVTITDAPLGPPATSDEIAAGVRAARAGADILLYKDSAPGELSALEGALRSGQLSRAEAAASYVRIVLLKRRVAG